ncbi:MAG: hypothetical protein ACP8RL_00295 [cyanobacterium endosymbiont of Rhopalodia inflata]
MTRQILELKSPIVVVDNQPMMQIPLRLTVLEAVVFNDICHQWLDNSLVTRQLILNFTQTQ